MNISTYFLFALGASLTLGQDEGCLGPICSGSDSDFCCPFTGWICCTNAPDYCGATEDICEAYPGKAYNLKSIFKAASKLEKNQCDGVVCPDDQDSTWCCPDSAFVCCDNLPNICAPNQGICEDLGPL